MAIWWYLGGNVPKILRLNHPILAATADLAVAPIRPGKKEMPRTPAHGIPIELHRDRY